MGSVPAFKEACRRFGQHLLYGCAVAFSQIGLQAKLWKGRKQVANAHSVVLTCFY